MDGSAAIINYPEVAILGVGRIIDKPGVIDGELAVRKMTDDPHIRSPRVRRWHGCRIPSVHSGRDRKSEVGAVRNIAGEAAELNRSYCTEPWPIDYLCIYAQLGGTLSVGLLRSYRKGLGGDKQHFRTDIQGMRALAVLGVVLYHGGVPFLPGGYIGVDIFFVISGFLITGLLLREVERSGRVSFRHFYARRIRRLLPASALVLIATVVGAKFLLPPLLLPDMGKDAAATSLFLANMRFAQTGTDYLAGTSSSPFQHYWSLALEEQFYLVWPLIMLLAAGTAALKRRKRIAVVLAVLTAVSLLGGIILTEVNQPWAFFSLPTRAWELGVGGLLALFAPALARLKNAGGLLVGLLGVATVVASMLLFTHDLAFPGWAALVPVLGAALMIAGGQSLHFLSVQPLQYFGNISYSLYLWHWPLLTLAEIRLGDDFNGWMAAGLVMLSVALAHVTYRFVELRFQHVQVLRTSLAKSYAFGAGLTIVALAASFGGTRLPALDAGKAVPVPTFEQLMSAPASPNFVPSNLTPSLQNAADSIPQVYTDGCHADYAETASAACSYGDASGAGHIVLFGDSHAAQWFTPLNEISKAEGKQLVSLTKSACPSVDIPVRSDLSETYPQCAEWRQESINRIKSLAPKLVVISNYSTAYRDLIPAADNFEQAWREGLSRTVQSLPAETKVVVIGDTPTWVESPNVCLSASLHDVDSCAAPRGELIDAVAHRIERETVQSLGGDFVSPLDWVCRERCSPIGWDKLVYRDNNHLTDEMASSLTGPLRHFLNASAA